MITQTRFTTYRVSDVVALQSEAPPEHEVTKNGRPVDSCPTVYVTPNMARDLAEKLLLLADDIDSGTPSSKSRYGTFKVNR